MAGRRLTWLHLSDLHVTPADDSGPARDQQRCWRALTRDIKEIREEKGVKGKPCTPDFVVLSGDVVKEGHSEDSFDHAHELVAEWCEAAAVPTDRVFVIPGNHDIDRSHVPNEHVFTNDGPGLMDLSRYGSRELREEVDKIWDSSGRHLIEQKFGNYRRFAERYAPVQWGPAHSWRARLEIEGLAVELIGLNSVWTGGHEFLDRPGVPVVGHVQREWIEGAAQDDDPPDLTFVLQHNPISYLHSVDSLRQASWTDDRDSIVLSGHLHESELAERRSVRGRHLELMGGALYSGYQFDRRYTFGVVEPREEERRFTVGLRSLAPENEHVAWDVGRYRGAKDGLVKFSQGSAASNLGTEIAPKNLLGIKLERARLRFDDGTYFVAIEKTYFNPTEIAWPCAEAQVMVNAYPDDVEKSRALYREHPLDLAEIEFTAECDGTEVTPTVLADMEASKSLLIPFGANGDSGLKPGEEATLAYSFRVERPYWGPYFERHISRETQQVECELDFPAGLLESFSLVKDPRLDATPLDDELEREESEGRELYRWSKATPPLQARYRFSWVFRTAASGASSGPAPASL